MVSIGQTECRTETNHDWRAATRMAIHLPPSIFGYPFHVPSTTCVRGTVRAYAGNYKWGFPMDITIYLPDEIGQWAKDKGLGLSRMLRDAVIEEQDRRQAIADSQDGMTETIIDTTNRYGEPGERLRFTGKEISGYPGCVTVYLTEAGQVLMVDSDYERYETFPGREEFDDWVNAYNRDSGGQANERVLSDALTALGLSVIVDIA
jgi:hypothetical protein